MRQLRITTTASTPPGTFPITVTGSPLNKTTTFNLVVNAVPFDYALTNSGPITVTQGAAGSTTLTATLTPTSGTAENVSFTAAPLPPGATAAFMPDAACTPTPNNCMRQLRISHYCLNPPGHVPDHRDRQSTE